MRPRIRRMSASSSSVTSDDHQSATPTDTSAASVIAIPGRSTIESHVIARTATAATIPLGMMSFFMSKPPLTMRCIMSLIDLFWEAFRKDPPKPRQPVPLEDDETTAFQASLVSENRVLKAELKRLGYTEFYIGELVRRGGIRS